MNRHRSALTLIEIMISLVLVATVLLVSLTASANLLRNHAQQRAAAQAGRLGEQILNEISALSFRDADTPVFGLEADETASDRTTYDDVDDYHGYVSTPPTHRDGTAIAGYQEWSFSVAVVPAAPDATGIVTSSDDRQPLRWVAVYCTAPDGTQSRATTLVSDVPSDVSPSVSFERWRQLTLQFAGREVIVGVPLRNAPDAD